MESGKRDGRREAKRQEILDVAKRIVARQGIERLSLRALASKLAVTPTAIYFYFPQKKSILRALCDAGMQELARRQTAHATISDPVERLYQHCLTYLRFALEETDSFRLLFIEPAFGALDDAPAIAKGAEEDSYEMGRSIVRRVIEKYRLGPEQHENELVQAVWAVVHGVACLNVSLASEPWFELGDPEMQYRRAFALFLRGLGIGHDRSRWPRRRK